MSQNDLRMAEAAGVIKSADFSEAPPAIVTPDTVYDNPEDFRVAIGYAQMEGLTHITVSERLMKHLSRSDKVESITYGSPGVRVYKVGCKEKLDKLESMRAEEYGDYIAKLPKA